MHASPSRLPESVRARIVEGLNARLADSLDLHSQIKVAHWNVKGPLFPSIHPLFDTFATSLAMLNDALAERAITLGGLTRGTSRHVAATSTLPDYPQDVTRDVEHVRLVAERIEKWLEGIRETRTMAEKEGDTDTVDLLTGSVSEFEKNAWFLRATLGT